MDTTTVGENISTRAVLYVLDSEEEIRRIEKGMYPKKRRKKDQEDGDLTGYQAAQIRRLLATEIKLLWDLTRPGLRHCLSHADKEEFLGLIVFLSLYLGSTPRERDWGNLLLAPPLGWRAQFDSWLERMRRRQRVWRA